MFLAYIDPGSGSILIQVILASCIGGIAVFWNKIKALFGIKPPPPQNNMICTTCGHTGQPGTRQNGSLIAHDGEFAMMKSPSTTNVCPKCGNATMIPLDTPMAQKLKSDLAESGSTNTENPPQPPKPE